jgi:hypothetical protein
MDSLAKIDEVTKVKDERRPLRSYPMAPTDLTRAVSLSRCLMKLTRVLAAAGCRRELSFQPMVCAPCLADLSDAWVEGSPGWTRLRALIDWTALHQDRISEVIAERPAPHASPMLAGLLASVAEKLADDHGLRRPRWTASVPPLDREWTPPGTPRMITKARADTPSQLRARNIVLAEHDLWRHVA